MMTWQVLLSLLVKRARFQPGPVCEPTQSRRKFQVLGCPNLTWKSYQFPASFHIWLPWPKFHSGNSFCCNHLLHLTPARRRCFLWEDTSVSIGWTTGQFIHLFQSWRLMNIDVEGEVATHYSKPEWLDEDQLLVPSGQYNPSYHSPPFQSSLHNLQPNNYHWNNQTTVILDHRTADARGDFSRYSSFGGFLQWERLVERWRGRVYGWCIEGEKPRKPQTETVEEKGPFGTWEKHGSERSAHQGREKSSSPESIVWEKGKRGREMEIVQIREKYSNKIIMGAWDLSFSTSWFQHSIWLCFWNLLVPWAWLDYLFL